MPAKFVIYPVPMPDVNDSGTSVDAAIAEIEAIETQYQIVYAYSDTVPAGEIIAQDPAAGQNVNEDTVVALTVSLGEEPEEAEALEEGGLRTKRSRETRKRYYVEIDQQRFEVSSPTHAQALLERAKEVARTHAQEVAERAVQKKRKPSKKPVTLPTPSISSPNPELKGAIQQAQAQINEVYRRAALDAELALLFARRMAEEDEEETLLLLM